MIKYYYRYTPDEHGGWLVDPKVGSRHKNEKSNPNLFDAMDIISRGLAQYLILTLIIFQILQKIFEPMTIILFQILKKKNQITIMIFQILQNISDPINISNIEKKYLI